MCYYCCVVGGCVDIIRVCDVSGAYCPPPFLTCNEMWEVLM